MRSAAMRCDAFLAHFWAPWATVWSVLVWSGLSWSGQAAPLRWFPIVYGILLA